MTTPEKIRRYQARKEAERKAQPRIPCACGCGTPIPPFTRKGRPARFAHGHNSRVMVSPGRFKPGQPSWNKGRPNPGASAAHRGKKLSPEEIARRTATRRAARDGAYQTKRGWKLSTETRQRISEANYRRDFRGERNPRFGKSLTAETRAKLSAAQTGAKHWRWQGGRGTLPYGPEFTRQFKRLIRERDGNRCQRCGITREALGRTLHVHHIDRNQANNDPQNLVTLCTSCHRQYHLRRGPQRQWPET